MHHCHAADSTFPSEHLQVQTDLASSASGSEGEMLWMRQLATQGMVGSWASGFPWGRGDGAASKSWRMVSGKGWFLEKAEHADLAQAPEDRRPIKRQSCNHYLAMKTSWNKQIDCQTLKIEEKRSINLKVGGGGGGGEVETSENKMKLIRKTNVKFQLTFLSFSHIKAMTFFLASVPLPFISLPSCVWSTT